MRFPFVLLDVGETLLAPRRSYGTVYAEVLERHGVARTPEAFEAALRHAWAASARDVPEGSDRYRWFDGGEEGYWLRFVEETLDHVSGIEDPVRLAREALPDLRSAFAHATAWRVYDDVVPALEAMRSDGIRLGVVSNWDSRLPGLLEKLGLSAFLDTIVVSHLEGIEKPDPEIFLRAIDRLGGRPDATLHVGDVAELDLEGARRAGIACILVDRKSLGESGRWTRPDLTDLPRIAREGV